jgi:hypothetical protein
MYVKDNQIQPASLTLDIYLHKQISRILPNIYKALTSTYIMASYLPQKHNPYGDMPYCI